MAQANYYIDPALHASAVPSTYVPPGNLVAVSLAVADPAAGLTSANNAAYILVGNTVLDNDSDVLSGYFTMGTATYKVVIPVGFAPTKVTVVDWTNFVRYEWFLGAPSTKSIKGSASSTYNSVDSGTAITVTADNSGGLGDVCYVTLAASLFTASDVVSFRIES